MPNKKEKKVLISLSVSVEEKKKFRKQAKAKGLTMAAWLRMLGFQNIARNDH